MFTMLVVYPLYNDSSEMTRDAVSDGTMPKMEDIYRERALVHL